VITQIRWSGHESFRTTIKVKNSMAAVNPEDYIKA
jgi:hypothetical protein